MWKLVVETVKAQIIFKQDKSPFLYSNIISPEMDVSFIMRPNSVIYNKYISLRIKVAEYELNTLKNLIAHKKGKSRKSF